jgi:hypothetical protein
MLQSFSRPEICLEGPHFDWLSCDVRRSATCSKTLCMSRKLWFLCLILVSVTMFVNVRIWYTLPRC